MKLKNELLNSENVGLAWTFNVSPSSCDNPEYYRNFVTLCAMDEAKAGLSRTHMFIDEEKNKLAGYISLRASALFYEDEGKIRAKPAVEISELAVDENYERKGVGTEMFSYAVFTADNLRDCVMGVSHIILCADPMAVEFYKKLGFDEISSGYKVPRDGWNDNCVPMYIRLPEK